MSLSKGTGPFGPKSRGLFNFRREGPAQVLYFEDRPRRVRVMFGGRVIADSRAPKLLHESKLLPVYYFPERDIQQAFLVPSDRRTQCPWKGEARFWHVRVGDRVAEDAVWSYPEPIESASWLAGYRAFYWQTMDAWYEEEEQVFVHPRDPYHRIDVLESSRHLQVHIDDRLVAETTRPRLLFETGLPARYYIPAQDVRSELLVPSRTTTRCPYKGLATYASARIGDQVLPDVTWSYDEPLPEAARIQGYRCFYQEKVHVIVDGEITAVHPMHA